LLADHENAVALLLVESCNPQDNCNRFNFFTARSIPRTATGLATSKLLAVWVLTASRSSISNGPIFMMVLGCVLNCSFESRKDSSCGRVLWFCTRICKPLRFGGFCSFGKLVRRRSRCCGNVGTRVLCGFPSSEGNARTLQSGSRFSALGASFPQPALDFVAFRTGCICEPVIRLKCTPFRKPRRTRTSPIPAQSPFSIVLVKDSEIHDCLILFAICLIS